MESQWGVGTKIVIRNPWEFSSTGIIPSLHPSNLISFVVILPRKLKSKVNLRTGFGRKQKTLLLVSDSKNIRAKYHEVFTRTDRYKKFPIPYLTTLLNTLALYLAHALM